MAKEILYGIEARNALSRGVDKLALVSFTYEIQKIPCFHPGYEARCGLAERTFLT